ncbi:reverse transcriptase domain-containing protein [Tanacetum coccineum]
MEPRPEPNREATLTLRLRSPVVRRQRERVVRFEEAPNREGSRRRRNAKGIRPSKIETREYENMGVNLPPLLAAHLGRNESRQPLRSSLTFVHGGHQPYTNIVKISLLMDYPLSDGIKMPSHIGSYDGKRDLDNFLYLFEGAIRMPKWLMPIACHMFTYTLKDSAHIWWNSQKRSSILNYKDLKAKFQSHFRQKKKFTKTHLAVHNIKQREGESTRAFVTRYTGDPLQILGLDEEQRISGFVYGLRTRNLVENLSTDLPSTYKDQENPLGIITEHRKAEIGSPHTGDLTTDCSPTCPKSQERSSPQKRKLEASNNLLDELYTKNKFKGLTSKGKEITFPSGGSNSSALGGQQCRRWESWFPPFTGPSNSTPPKGLVLYSRHTNLIRRRSLLLPKDAFGLKNAGATYQRLVDKVFHDQIGRNLEAYVDDMVIKSMSEEEMLADIKETFEKFRSINMKLNPKKCSFDVEEGPFLGHLITKQGIRDNPSKVKAITDVKQLKTYRASTEK